MEKDETVSLSMTPLQAEFLLLLVKTQIKSARNTGYGKRTPIHGLIIKAAIDLHRTLAPLTGYDPDEWWEGVTDDGSTDPV